MAKYPLKVNQIIHGHTLDVLKEFSDNSIDMVCTSPPYWSLRDYRIEPIIWDGDPNCQHEWGDYKIRSEGYTGSKRWQHKESRDSNPDGWSKSVQSGAFCLHCNAWKGSLGLEPDFNLYLDHLIQIFAEVKRVLKKEGSCFVNLGDSYSGGWGNRSHKPETKHLNRYDVMSPEITPATARVRGIPSKSLCGIPERFAIRMTDELGWIRRNTIVWWKPNCMPASATDRFTVDWEPFYFFTKSPKYYFKQQFEPYLEALDRWGGDKLIANGESMWNEGTGQDLYRTRDMRPNEQGRNKRCVWKIPTQPTPEAHFAVFPEALVQTPIDACCPEQICKKCGKAREIIYKKNQIGRANSNTKYDLKTFSAGSLASKRQAYRELGLENPPLPKVIGLTDCGCNILKCVVCSYIINDYDTEEYGKQKSNKTKVSKKEIHGESREVQELSTSISEGLSDMQKDILGQEDSSLLQSEMRSPITDKKGDSQQLPEGSSPFNLEGGNNKQSRLQDYNSQWESETRASDNNGELSEPKSRSMGRSPSSERDKDRQSNREFRNSDKENPSRANKMSSLQPMVLYQIECPQCKQITNFKEESAGFEPGIVCDIFAGTGTTCYVAKEMGRKYIGIDLKPQYIDMAEKKTAQVMLL